MEIIEVFETILRKWFEKELYRMNPFEAKQRLVNILKMSRCSEYVVDEIEKTFVCNMPDILT